MFLAIFIFYIVLLRFNLGGGFFINDLPFNRGSSGVTIKLSSITVRNVTFNCYINGITILSIVEISSSLLHFNNYETGTLTIFDSLITNVKVRIASSFGNATAAPFSNSVILGNVQVENVQLII